jgi:hypothetical protein
LDFWSATRVISPYFPLIYFFYGLAFFSMGLAITLSSAMPPTSACAMLSAAGGFGSCMVSRMDRDGEQLQILPVNLLPLVWDAIRLAILAFSFLSLAAFGMFLIIRDPRWQRYIFWCRWAWSRSGIGLAGS